MNIIKAIKLLAQRGRYGEGISTKDLEDIYEWTYKLQMLEQEENLGDYGLPQLLPDRAYMEKAKLEAALEIKLNEVYERMIEIYDDWLRGHEATVSDFYDEAYERWNNDKYEYEHAYITIDDLGLRLGGDNLKETIIDYIKELREENEEEEEDEFGERMKYLDRIKEKVSQQRNFEYMGLPPEDPAYVEPKPLEELSLKELEDLPEFKENLDDIFEKVENTSYFDDYTNAEAEMLLEEFENNDYDSPYAAVKSMRIDMAENWDELSIDDKVIKFQEALTTMHNNGEMAEYVLDDDNAIDILNDLSSSKDVPVWDQELSRLLGYEPRSRLSAPSQDWFVPAFVKRFAKIISYLDILCK